MDQCILSKSIILCNIAQSRPVSGVQESKLLLDNRVKSSRSSAHGKLHAALEVLAKAALLDLWLNVLNDGLNEAVGVGAVSLEVTDNGLNSNRLLLLAPGVVVGGHADHLVADLGLLGKLAFRDGTHIDDTAIPAAVQPTLGTSRESRALHADQSQVLALGGLGVQFGLLVVSVVIGSLQSAGELAEELVELEVKGFTETNVSNSSLLKESAGSDTLSAVNDLSRDDKVTGFDVVLERTNSGKSHNSADTNVLESGNVGSGRDVTGRELVVDTVTGQEGNGESSGSAGDDNGRRSRSPRSLNVELGDRGQARKLVEASTANDSQKNGLYGQC